MTDWTPQDDWTLFSVGDTVRFVRSDDALVGRIKFVEEKEKGGWCSFQVFFPAIGGYLTLVDGDGWETYTPDNNSRITVS
jgi:hypothetical protein